MKQPASKTKAIKKPRQPKTRTARRNLANPKNETDRYLAQLQAAFSTAPLGLAILATDLRYVRVNETLATMNGIPAEEHTGKTVRDIVPGIADEVENIVQAVTRTGKPVCLSLIHISEPTRPY
jgi:PAS domain-containing protein